MRKVLFVFVLLAAVVVANAAVVAPTAVLTVGEQTFQLNVQQGRTDKVWRILGEIETSDFSFDGQADINTDPYIDYGFSFKNFTGGNLAFSISINTPYILGPYTLATSTHASTVTDAAGTNPANGSVTITPAAGGAHQPNYDGTPFGAINGDCNLTGTAGFSLPCNSDNQFLIPVNTAAAGLLSVSLGATVSAGDRYSFNGLAEIHNVVPEPSTYALIGGGLLLLGTIRRRLN